MANRYMRCSESLVNREMRIKNHSEIAILIGVVPIYIYKDKTIYMSFMLYKALLNYLEMI